MSSRLTGLDGLGIVVGAQLVVKGDGHVEAKQGINSMNSRPIVFSLKLSRARIRARDRDLDVPVDNRICHVRENSQTMGRSNRIGTGIDVTV